jgi:hypothetical protein
MSGMGPVSLDLNEAARDPTVTTLGIRSHGSLPVVYGDSGYLAGYAG